MTESAADAVSLEIATHLTWQAAVLGRWGKRQALKIPGLRMTMPQISLLWLVRHDVTTSAELARQMEVTPRAITSVVDKLVAKGLLLRQDDPHDRRIIRLVLTPEGERVSGLVESLSLTPLAELISRLEPGERDEFERSVNRFAEIMAVLDELPAE
ncbi:MAG: MarR family transcriptional regulator [Thermomicrobiales bacterium]|nr:MarR family transcriptional regulator [Thermomicrobiales bacterium]